MRERSNLDHYQTSSAKIEDEVEMILSEVACRLYDVVAFDKGPLCGLAGCPADRLYVVKKHPIFLIR